MLICKFASSKKVEAAPTGMFVMQAEMRPRLSEKNNEEKSENEIGLQVERATSRRF